jgi:steroid delta-isomerase-like uncharacterized protein
MALDDVKAVVVRYIEAVWNGLRPDALDDLTTPEFTYHLAGQQGRDRAAMREFLTTSQAAFPDWRVRPVQVVAEGDTVVVRWDGEATHQGPFHGLPPTGRRVRVSGINVYRVEAGKVAAEWEQTDSIGLLRQLGVTFAAPTAAPGPLPVT